MLYQSVFKFDGSSKIRKLHTFVYVTAYQFDAIVICIYFSKRSHEWSKLSLTEDMASLASS